MKKILRKLRSALASAWDFTLLLFVLAAFGEPEDYPSADDEVGSMKCDIRRAAGSRKAADGRKAD